MAPTWGGTGLFLQETKMRLELYQPTFGNGATTSDAVALQYFCTGTLVHRGYSLRKIKH